MGRKRSINFYIGGILAAFLVLMFLISFIYVPHETNQMNVAKRLAAPDSSYLLGTDNFGRDILSRIMKGSQTAFFVGASAVAIGLAGGILIGTAAGYLGYWTDELLMRLMDAILSFPGIIFALILVTVFKPGIYQTVVAIGVLSIPGFARIVRASVLEMKEAEFVKAAKGFGASHFRILSRYIFPNILSSIIVAATLSFSTAILIEAALSYLGLGVQPPHPSWGRMLSEAQGFLQQAPWFAITPGLFITLLVLGFNLLGDGIRDVRDVRR